MTTSITYRFLLPNQEPKSFELLFDMDYQLILAEEDSLPEWIRLGYKQCAHCPLNEDEVPVCPLARAIKPLVDFSAHLVSYQEVAVEIEMEGRTIRVEGALQRGLSSLMGLIIPTSGCPVTSVLRPLARYHLPNAGRQETNFRVFSSFFLACQLADPPCDKPIEKVLAIYKELHQLNESVANRMRAAVQQDSSVNALIILDAFTLFVPMEVDDSLAEIRHFLEPMIERVSEPDGSG